MHVFSHVFVLWTVHRKLSALLLFKVFICSLNLDLKSRPGWQYTISHSLRYLLYICQIYHLCHFVFHSGSKYILFIINTKHINNRRHKKGETKQLRLQLPIIINIINLNMIYIDNRKWFYYRGISLIAGAASDGNRVQLISCIIIFGVSKFIIEHSF